MTLHLSTPHSLGLMSGSCVNTSSWEGKTRPSGWHHGLTCRTSLLAELWERLRGAQLGTKLQGKMGELGTLEALPPPCGGEPPSTSKNSKTNQERVLYGEICGGISGTQANRRYKCRQQGPWVAHVGTGKKRQEKARLQESHQPKQAWRPRAGLKLLGRNGKRHGTGIYSSIHHSLFSQSLSYQVTTVVGRTTSAPQ